MKKVFVAVVAVVALASCKKDWTCECTGSEGWAGYSGTITAKKKDAETACKAWDATYSAFGASCKLK